MPERLSVLYTSLLYWFILDKEDIVLFKEFVGSYTPLHNTFNLPSELITAELGLSPAKRLPSIIAWGTKLSL